MTTILPQGKYNLFPMRKQLFKKGWKDAGGGGGEL